MPDQVDLGDLGQAGWLLARVLGRDPAVGTSSGAKLNARRPGTERSTMVPVVPTGPCVRIGAPWLTKRAPPPWPRRTRRSLAVSAAR